MKIIICLHHFLPEVVGGTEIYTLCLAHHLKKLGVEAMILIPNLGNPLTNEYEYEEIRIIRYAENSVEDRKMIMGKKAPDGLGGFAEILKNENPDIIHFHELAPGRGINIFHVEKAHELNIPIVLTFHLAAYTCFKGSLIYKEIKKCDGIIKIKRCTDCVYHAKNITGVKAKFLSNIAVSLFNLGINPTALNSTIGTALGFPFVINKIKNDLLRFARLAEKIVVLSDWYKDVVEKNGIGTEKLVFMKQGLTSKSQKHINAIKVSYPLKIVFLGRIARMKGLHLLIEAVCKIPEEKISLYIYGPELDDHYARECRKKSVSKINIFWQGTIPSEDVIPTLSNYHLLCLPSYFEMSALVVQEAFAAGLPILASDVYGNAEQITDGVNGWLFRFKDGDHLLEKLKLLINDLSSIEAARLHLPAPGMFKEIATEHFKLYKEIIQCKKSKELLKT